MPCIVHIVGTGTIGEPLIGLLADHRTYLGIDEVTFHKRTPLKDEVAKVNDLIARGAKLAVDPEKALDFGKLGHIASFDKLEALTRATVVIDCTPAGNLNKKELYEKHVSGPVGFIAQGSEKDFGIPYALGINDDAVMTTPRTDPRFMQVVSCNTHNISAILKALSFNAGPEWAKTCFLGKATFLCMRRANDISQDKSFIASPEVCKHSDARFGTHHARDAFDLFAGTGIALKLWSSAVKLNTQYMHAIWFCLELERPMGLPEVLRRFEEEKRIALTYKKSANKIFSYGRDHGYYGRILNHTVVVRDTIAVDGNSVMGFCFTPQDGNSLLSSVAAVLMYINRDNYRERLDVFSRYLYQEV